MRGNTANGPNIRRRRKRLGLTQEDLANLAEVDVKTIRNAEASRNLDVRTLQRIALELSIELSNVTVTSSDSDLRAIQRTACVNNWLEALLRRDVEGMISIYSDQARWTHPLHTPAQDDASCQGNDALRRSAESWLACTELERTPNDQHRIHCADQFVFLRGASPVSVSSGTVVTVDWLHEFEFVGSTVVRHVTLFDTASLRSGWSNRGSG